jgi:leucine dehydrogenase
VLIQGVGAVGTRLAHLVYEAGAHVILADENASRAVTLSSQLGGGRVIDPDEVFDTPCDVYSPNAVGGTLNVETIPRLRCAVVAGAANNQLREPADAERLRERGILYAPDYVINSGGIIRAEGAEVLRWPEPEIDRRVEAIGKTLAEIYRAAHVAHIDTNEAAGRLAKERLLASA